MTVPIDPIAVAVSVARTLDALGIMHTIGGSIASSIAGEPRSTIDIDVVATLCASDVPALVSALSADFYVNEEALRRAVRERSTANVIHQATQIKVDICVAGGTPLDTQQLGRRRAVEIAPGRTLHVHPPEDILLQKLVGTVRVEKHPIVNGATSSASSESRRNNWIANTCESMHPCSVWPTCSRVRSKPRATFSARTTVHFELVSDTGTDVCGRLDDRVHRHRRVDSLGDSPPPMVKPHAQPKASIMQATRRARPNLNDQH